jgi:hypothetical protein
MEWQGIESYEDNGQVSHFRVKGCWVVGRLEGIRHHIGEPEQWGATDEDLPGNYTGNGRKMPIGA